MTSSTPPNPDGLQSFFEEQFGHMQTPEHRAAVDKLFAMSEEDFHDFLAEIYRTQPARPEYASLDFDPGTREAAYTLVGPGWRSLLDEIFDHADSVRVRPFQIKAKFGRLRVVWPWKLLRPDIRPSDIWDRCLELSSDVEKRSGQICEVCAAAGTLVEDPGKAGWKVTLCESHEEARAQGERWRDLMGYLPYTMPADAADRGSTAE